MAGARALWRATGMTDDDFGKPIVAIAKGVVFDLDAVRDRACHGLPSVVVESPALFRRPALEARLDQSVWERP